MNAEEAAKVLQSGNPLEVKAGGEVFHVLSDEVEVKAHGEGRLRGGGGRRVCGGARHRPDA
jgi:hypothetical protein